MLCWTNLTNSTNANALLDTLVSPDSVIGLANDNGSALQFRGAAVGLGNAVQNLVVPLQFSFCRNPGLALPLIALQYHDVELIFNYSSAAELAVDNNAANMDSAMSNTSLFVDYIFLDTEERKNFAQNPHEYLIETVQEQTQSVTTGTASVRLDFNHPVKELLWAGRDVETDHDSFTNFTTDTGAAGTSGSSCISQASLKLNGQERFASQSAAYFNHVQPYQYHTGVPLLGLNAYSFALKPEEHQPSGTCNFSRIDNASLEVTSAVDCNLTVMAHGYNVLRVASGMGGLAYSN